ncbi:putative snf1 kinase complex beta-subunit gal83 [Phaeomoniella chlamydospora]|uniref:Putative snf1 kinase complex beta-subunit gal83 n=1 Tax=Phaeomoniella chlamydospora TaxID=158046 RepID=A0A0G2DXZ6_PHACM|nr:putative snf1 kinase complex beta-subunit gal83 [Phaeomoniella chlamydospora]
MNVPGSAEKTVSKESGGHRPESPVPNYLAEYAKLQRPPRLPLPIAEVDHAPGSPLTEPVMPGAEDVSIFDDDDADLPRKSSMLSSTTVEDEDIGDELSSFSIDANIAVKVVPIVVEWKQPGDKVYVTGTFANWAKKYKLHRNKDGRGMSVALQLPPGTHHVKFIVDGEMKNSDHLPTAVDFNNVLVNYIEVSADDINRMRQDHTRFSPETPRPGVGQHEKQRPESPDYGEDGGPESRRRSLDEEEVLDSDYRQLVPQALVDIDRESDSEERNTAATILSEGQGPPTLPLFLGKSILNGVLPMKDDASVLTLPNHTVLNHLATSSIKNGVLATSVTTRYKKKYVTTIMYKPTGLEEKQKVRDEQLQQQREQREQQRKKSQSQEKPDQLQEIVEQQPQEPLQATEETEAEQQHKQDEQRPSEQV